MDVEKAREMLTAIRKYATDVGLRQMAEVGLCALDGKGADWRLGNAVDGMRGFAILQGQATIAVAPSPDHARRISRLPALERAGDEAIDGLYSTGCTMALADVLECHRVAETLGAILKQEDRP